MIPIIRFFSTDFVSYVHSHYEEIKKIISTILEPVSQLQIRKRFFILLPESSICDVRFQIGDIRTNIYLFFSNFYVFSNKNITGTVGIQSSVTLNSLRLYLST